ncbi:MAG: hypothetical protein ACREQW_14840, partial [Candidatus Binatia bacterium]
VNGGGVGLHHQLRHQVPDGTGRSERGGMNTRAQNELKFRNWEELPRGGRRYWLDVPGRLGWRARYLKEVDAQEVTLRFWQEIYDEDGKLVEVHEKYPVDKAPESIGLLI